MAKKLSADELALLEGKLGPLLSERGFSPSGVAPIEPTPVARTLLGAQNKAAISGHGSRGFGLRDVAMEIVFRKLGLRRLSHGVRERMQRKKKKFLA